MISNIQHCGYIEVEERKKLIKNFGVLLSLKQTAEVLTKFENRRKIHETEKDSYTLDILENF